jgi:hypothetical protein
MIVVRKADNSPYIATTPPMGLGCPDTIPPQTRIVISSAPFTALRLAQLGCKGALIAIDPAHTLPPLHDWLKDREIIVVGTSQRELDVLSSSLNKLSDRAKALKLPWAIQQASLATLRLLGITERGVDPKPLRAEPTPAQIVELVRYAQARLAAGAATEALARHGIDDPGLIETFALGYIPGDFRFTLSKEVSDVWTPLRLGDTLIAPAFDEQGVPVDFMVLGNQKVCVSLFRQPRGLVAPRVATAFQEIVVTDSLKTVIKLHATGWRNVLVLRGGVDAGHNAERLSRSGVRQVRHAAQHECSEIAHALSRTGIQVITGALPINPHRDTAPLPSPAVEPTESIVMESHDPRTEKAIFKAGDATYTVEAGLESQSRLAVRLERSTCVHIDRFDLASDAQRQRFAAAGALKVQMPRERIEQDLVAILEALQRLQEQALSPDRSSAPSASISETDRAVGLAMLKRPDLLDTIAADLEALGWVGESEQKRLLYLTATSRKLPHPLSAVRIAASGAGKSFGLELVAELTPPEDLIHVTRLTDTSLYYHDRDGLRHKLLVIDEAAALTPEALTALRILQSRGALTQSYVQRDPNGATVTQFAEVKGPVSVLTSAVGSLDEQNLSRCFCVPVDETPAQTAAVLQSQRRLRTVEATQRDGIIHRHRIMQRLLEPLPVLIPFADRIEFPASSVKHRREQERFLNLIEASALLHQHQRMRNGAHVVAATRDFEIAKLLAAESIARAGEELSQNARDLLALLIAAKLESFTMEDLKALRPDWTRHRFRHGLDELVRLEVLISPTNRRGVLRTYTLPTGAERLLGSAGVRLRTLGEMAEDGEGAATNLTHGKIGA